MVDAAAPPTSVSSTLSRQPRRMAPVVGAKMAGLMVIVSGVFGLFHLASPVGQQMGSYWKIREAVLGFLVWGTFSSLTGGIAAVCTASRSTAIDRVFFGALIGGITGSILLAMGCALDAIIPSLADVKKFPPLDAAIFGAVVGGVGGCAVGGVAGAAAQCIRQNAMAALFCLLCGFLLLSVVSLVLVGGLF